MIVLHFVIDEKFINGIIAVLDEIKELDNRYFIISKKEKCKFITSERVQRISSDEVSAIINDSKSCDVIVIHSLPSLPLQYISAIDKRIKVVWLSWGYDIYTNLTYPHEPLVPLKNIIKKGTLNVTNKFIYYSIWFTREHVMRFFRIKEKAKHNFLSAISRIDYYSGVFPEEYDIIKANNSFFIAKPITFHYLSQGTKTRYRKENIYKDICNRGKDIQVGHNAAYYSNHRNTFNLLKEMNLDGRKIIVPLSYSGNWFYVSSVCKLGYKFFKDKFVPIRKYMPIEEYRKYLSSISVAIYNFERQAAAGNITMNLWNGTMVFLSENSIGYKHFKSLGFHVFSIEHDLTQENIDKGLTEEQIIENRSILSQINTYEVQVGDIVRSFRYICNAM